MAKKTKKTEHQEFLQKRDELLPMLAALEKTHGKELIRSAMRKHLQVSAERERHQADIFRLKARLLELEGQKA